MIIYGKNIVKEAVHVKRPIFNLYLDEKFNDRDFINFLEKNKVKFSFKDKGELNNLTNKNKNVAMSAKSLAMTIQLRTACL